MMVELASLKKRDLKLLQSQVASELRRRYFDHRPPKYGDLNKTFSNEEELHYFLNHVKNLRVRTVFLLQAYLGLRISEACKIQTRDIDFLQRRVWIRSAKGSTPSSMFLHEELFRPLLKYYEQYAAEIIKTGYLFPSYATQNYVTSKYQHISPEFCRNHFTMARKKAQLEIVYAESEESDPDRPVRRLQKFTTHSFRRFFIQHVHRKTGDLMLTQKLARHRNVKNTLIYLHANQEELDQVLQETFQ